MDSATGQNVDIKSIGLIALGRAIDHFTVVMAGSKVAGDLVVMQTSSFFLCKCRLVASKQHNLHDKNSEVYQNKVTDSLAAIHRPGH